MTGRAERAGARPRKIATAALFLAVSLTACTSEDERPLGAYGDLGRIVAETVAGPAEPPPAREWTRAELDEIASAAIALSFEDTGRTVLVPLSDAGGYVTYQDRNRRGVRLHGGAVAGTLGFGQDLLAVRHQLDDPVADPTPLADWPGQVDREYQYRLRELANFSITVTCVFDRVVREEIEIVELRYDTIRIVETCRNARRSFENTYWAEPDTGFIWKSRQWTGPNIRPVTVEIIRPYRPG